MATLHKEGESHLKALIEAGKYNTDQSWSFSAEDGDKLLGDKGGDWGRYSSVHLGEDTTAADNTKDRWKYPAAKAKGDSEEVFRKGLISAKQRAAQQKDRDVEQAAARLIDLIDEKENPAEEKTETPEDEKNEGEAARSAMRAAKPSSARDLPRVMTRIFGTPLMIAPEKLEVIMSAIGPRLGIAASPASSDKQADAIGAFFGMDDEESDEDKPYELTPDGIAVLCIEGTLVYKTSWLGAMSGLTGYGDIKASLDAAMSDPAVKGILLQIDSYGGEVNGCFDLSDAIATARASKPVYAVASDDAYSAAYALASAASKLYVSRTSGVGSIGVVALHVDMSEADKNDGLKYSYIYSGDHKIDGNPHQPLSSQARDTIQAECDRLRMLFAASVARYRSVPVADLVAMQAACFYGDSAVSAKLADAVGTPDDALAALRAHISDREKTVSTMPAPTGLSGALSASSREAAVTQQKPADVIDLAAVREHATVEAALTHAEIAELCALAKHPSKTAEFIRRKLSVADVRKELLNLRAAAGDAMETHGHIMPDAGDNASQRAAAGWDQAFAAVSGNAKKGK